MNRFFMRGATVGASAPGRDSVAGEALDCGLTPTPEDAERSTPAWLWWGGLALLVAGLIAPILAVDVPPLADYPNHLARCFFLAFGAEDPVLQSMFATHWDLIPNLAIDLILPPLMHIMPPLLAGKLVVALTVLLAATGTIALSRACFGRLSLWQLGAGFVSYNAMFLIGLLNFQLAVGVALWGAAAWIATSSRHPFVGALIGAGFALVAFVFHIFGFCFFALLIGCAELAAILRRGFDDAGAWRFALGRTVTTTAALLPTAALYTVSPLAGANGHTVSLPLASKLILLLAPVLGYSPWIQQAVAVALFITLLAWWRARGQLLVAPLAWACLPLLLLIYAALPVGAKGGYWIDTRMPVLFGYTLFATTMPHRLGRREAVVATMAFLALFVGRMAYITEIWAGSQQDVADVRRALTPVTPGSRVLMMQANPYQHAQAWVTMPPSRIAIPGLPPSYWHYAAFALIDRRAYWSDAFTLHGQQPMTTLPPYQASGDGGASPPHDYTELRPYLDAATAPDPASYLAGWPDKFDYILLMNAEAVPDLDTLLPKRLTLLDRQGFAALFQVKRQGARP